MLKDHGSISLEQHYIVSDLFLGCFVTYNTNEGDDLTSIYLDFMRTRFPVRQLDISSIGTVSYLHPLKATKKIPNWKLSTDSFDRVFIHRH